MKRLLLYLAFSCCGVASDVPSLHDVLQKTGKAVEEFWVEFSAINCTETVSQRKLSKEGKVVYGRESAFDYVVLMREADGDLVVEESRTSLRSKGNEKKAPLLVTNGLSTLLFIFHPQFQNSFEYSQPVEDGLEGRSVLRVEFRQVKGGRSPSCLRLRGRDYPLEWTGTAWIERQSGSIAKIAVAPQSSVEDLGLRTLNAEVSYAPVKFKAAPKQQWLPLVARMEVQTPRQRWQNIHHFTDYKHFDVETSTGSKMGNE